MSGKWEFPMMPREDVEKLLNHPISKDERLEAWIEYHERHVKDEIEKRDQAWLETHGRSKMVPLHQAWVDMHEAHIRLLKAIIAVDPDALSKWDEARRAEDTVEAVGLAYYQAGFPMEMTKALNEANLRRAERNLAQAQAEVENRKQYLVPAQAEVENRKQALEHAQAEAEYHENLLDWAQTKEAEAQAELKQAQFLASA
jgi:hypothetical protein